MRLENEISSVYCDQVIDVKETIYEKLFKERKANHKSIALNISLYVNEQALLN